MILISSARNSPRSPIPRWHGQAFFENAGGSYTCAPVIDRLTRFYRERKVQPYAPYDASRLGGEEMDEARRRLAAMLGVATDELSFGPSTTQNTYVLAQAFRQMLQPGDAIVVTNQDHEANSGPWRRLADTGTEVREWQIDPETGHLDAAGLEALLDDKVRLVCFPHCSNVVGEINDVAGIMARVHAAGAVACVDGVSYAPHGLPDVGALGRGYLSVFGLQDLWPASGADGDPPRPGGTAAQSGASFQRWDALQTVHARRARIMRRSPPARGWRIISTCSIRAISRRIWNRATGRPQCMI